MKHKFGIQGKLFLSLIIFSVIVISLLWVLQFVFLDDIYREIQIASLREAASEVSRINDDNYTGFALNHANGKSQCTAVYDANAAVLCSEHAGGQCVVHNLSINTVRNLYLGTKETEDLFFETYLTSEDMGIIINSKKQTGPDFPFFHENEVSYDEAYDCLLFCQITENKNGQERFILQSALIIPLDSTVDTLYFELMIVSVVLLLLSLVLSVVLSQIISKPLISLNKASKSLSKGDFVMEGREGYREVAELRDTLSGAANEISKVDRLRSELIANVSHDLRTPLTLIESYSEAMRDLPGENTPENLQIIIDETHRLSGLVTDLLDLSRLESDMNSFSPERIDLHALCAEIVYRYDKMLEKDQYRFFLEADGLPSYVLADRSKITQVIYNLIHNAINYCGSDRTVIIRLIRTQTHIRLEVIDHGEGIAKEHLADIWDRYYRLKDHHRTAKIGSGLGLSIVKKVLELHGAFYGVDSKVGEGSCFWFLLPLA